MLGFILFIVAFLITWVLTEVFIYRKITMIKNSIRQSRNQQPITGRQQQSALSELENEIIALSIERKEESERLEKLETYRKEFLGNVSHELKTPIFNIQGYIHTLLDGAINDIGVNRDYLQRAVKSVDRMITIIDDLQTITQLEKGELILDEEPFDLTELCNDALHSQELNAKTSSILLEFSADSVQKVIVLADRFRIRQVLVNLIVNSIRYGKENGRTVIRISDAGDKVIVEVSDNGLGIAKENLSRIFERFYRVDKSRSRELGGSGLGLSIVKHIIEAHHQSIDVMSTEGVGSVFSFSLRKSQTE
ncbi:MAG: sensor histidine kinase [Bacteroidia bacterium]|nr:sensor histidine kinase [Bacteroidia bacterium]